MKKINIYLLIILLIALLGCNTGKENNNSNKDKSSNKSEQKTDKKEEEKEGMDKYLFAIIKGSDYPQFESWNKSSEKSAEGLGIPSPIVQSPQNPIQSKQDEIINGLANRGINGMGIFPIDIVEVNKSISSLASKGIPVIAIERPPARPTDAVFCCGSNLKAAVSLAMDKVIEKLGTKGGNIIHFTGDKKNPETKIKEETVESIANNTPNISLLQSFNITNIKNAQKTIDIIFSEKKDQIDGIICTDYISSMVAAKKLTELNENNMVVIGFDDSKEVLKAIENENMYGTIIQNRWGQAYAAITGLKLLADGYEYKPDSPYILDCGSFFLGKEDVSKLKEKIEKMTSKFLDAWEDKYFDKPIK